MTMENYRELLSSDRFARSLGIEFLEARDGFARLQMRLTDEHKNFFGATHGGAIFALADASFGAAANAQGYVTAAIHVSIDFLKGPRNGGLLTATCSQNLKGKVGQYTMVVEDEEGTVIALCNGWARRTMRPLVPEE
jgi:acyl-CoA thioesterase